MLSPGFIRTYKIYKNREINHVLPPRKKQPLVACWRSNLSDDDKPLAESPLEAGP